MANAPVKKTKPVSDWLNRPVEARTDLLEKRKKLWDALAKFIHAEGGHVTSAPHTKTLRIEVPQGSALPAKLTELGYSPRHLSTGMRIQIGAFLPVDVIEISLPGK